MSSLSTPILTGLLARVEDYNRLRAALDPGKSPLALSGLSAVHRAYVAAALRRDTGRPLAVICADAGEARRAAALGSRMAVHRGRVIPSTKTMGRNTHTVVRVEEVTAPATWPAPATAA